KARKVSTDVVRTLIVDYNEDELDQRLLTARVSLRPQAMLVAIVDDDENSPFKNMVDWPRRRGEGHHVVKPMAIEDSLRYIKQNFSHLNDDDDALIDFFFAIWN